MSIDQVTNFSTSGNLFHHFGPPFKHYPMRTMLNFRDRNLRMMTTEQKHFYILKIFSVSSDMFALCNMRTTNQ